MDTSNLPVLSVTEFNTLVNDTLGRIFVWVKGEISGFRISQNKWVTFDLKDEGSKINCFMTKYQLDQVLEDGMEIKALGVPRVYVPYGKYSFTIQRVEPVGEGALRRAFELTRQKLEQEGLFDPAHKKPIPRFPRTIGLVTSPEAAAYTDFLRILENRWGGVEVVVRPSLVQGVDAPGQLADALNWFNRHHPVDVIVLTRGGGSMEDLMAFNSETVCRAVYASRIPVVCGVGHERDVTLAELVADVRASTPSNAAERVVPDRKEIDWQLNLSAKQMDKCVTQQVTHIRYELRERMAHLEHHIRQHTTAFTDLQQRMHLAFSAYKSKLQTGMLQLDHQAARMDRRMANLLQDAASRLGQLQQLCQSFNPRQVLQRGYAIPRLANGQIIRKLDQVRVGQTVQTELTDGVFASEVLEKGKRLTINKKLL